MPKENGYKDLCSNRPEFEELSIITSGLAHEIRNPLSTIKVNLKLVSEDLDKNDAKLARAVRKIALIQKETERLEHILDNFLRYAGRAEFQFELTNINEIVSDMVDFFAPQAYKNLVTIRVGLCEHKLMCMVDKIMLKQVLLNLFLNAQQAMPGGGELIIRTRRDRNDAVIEIGDTGVGIGNDKLDRIFDVYYSSRPGGSGLGLPTAKKIVSGHKGRIEVFSDVNKGSMFSVYLPLQNNYAE